MNMKPKLETEIKPASIQSDTDGVLDDLDLPGRYLCLRRVSGLYIHTYLHGFQESFTTLESKPAHIGCGGLSYPPGRQYTLTPITDWSISKMISQYAVSTETENGGTVFLLLFFLRRFIAR